MELQGGVDPACRPAGAFFGRIATPRTHPATTPVTAPEPEGSSRKGSRRATGELRPDNVPSLAEAVRGLG
ncbi:hypothetical protein NDU88_003895 [Pleurodeles waltl]|uniref:Uncharacterized protein n=1 Tax=Pleurodeles waltl TaxID=8319 RepID=A0AAV7NHV2_PLEWA|nr:hypothetical protein NDU88_003895 [Pleurodeles waltl]